MQSSRAWGIACCLLSLGGVGELVWEHLVAEDTVRGIERVSVDARYAELRGRLPRGLLRAGYATDVTDPQALDLRHAAAEYALAPLQLVRGPPLTEFRTVVGDFTSAEAARGYARLRKLQIIALSPNGTVLFSGAGSRLPGEGAR